MNTKLLIFFIVFILSFSTASAYNLSLNDVHVYYTFDNANVSGTTIYDEAGNADGTFSNAVMDGFTGIVNQAFSFQSGDYVESASYSVGSGKLETSISMWVYLDNSGSDDYFFRHGNYNSFNAGERTALIGTAGGNIRWAVYSTDGSQDANDCTYTLNASEWYHLVGVYNYSNSDKMVTYVNGKDISNTCSESLQWNGADTLNSNSKPIQVGRMRSSLIRPLDGLGDEFIYFNRALSPDEVTSLYASGSPQTFPYSSASYKVSIDNLYFSPNVTVYTDSSITGTVVINDTTESPQANFYLKVDNVTVENKTTTSFSGSTATSSAFSSSNFKQGDWLSMCVTITNSTNFSQVYASEQCTSEVQVQNRIPSGVLSWSVLNPLNNTNFSGIITPSDADSDTLNFTYDIYKNGVLDTSGSSNNHASPYGAITLFTIDASTTQVGDNYTFNVSIFDGYDSFATADSANNVVTDTANFTIIANDAWTGLALEDYYFYINDLVENNATYVSDPSCGLLAGCLNYTITDFFAKYNNTIINNSLIYSKNTLKVAHASSVPSGNTFFYYVYSNDTLGPLFAQSTGGFVAPVITTGNVTYSNSSTYITSIISNETANITVFYDDYFTRVYTDWNLSNNLNARLHQSEYTFSTYEIITGDEVTGVTYTIDGLSYEQFNLSAGPHTVTASKAGVIYTSDLTFNATPLAQENLNITGFYNQIINITAKEFTSSSPISNFNVTITYGDYEESYSTSTGRIEIPAVKGLEYNISINGLGVYASSDTLINSTANNEEYEFTLFPFNSVNINVYDYDTLALIDNQTVNFEIIGANTSTLNTSSDGTLLYSFLTAFTYEIIVTTDNKVLNKKYVTVAADSTQNISFYMRNNESTELLELLVTDGANNELEGAIVWLQKRKSGTSSQLWYTVQEAETDSSGETAVYVKKGIEHYYRFAVFYEGEIKPILPNNEVYTTATFFIPGVSEQRQLKVNLLGVGNGGLVAATSYYGDVTLSSDNNTFNFLFLDGGNAISGGILRIYAKYLTSNLTTELINTQIVSGTSGEISYSIPAGNNTYWEARGYVYFSDGREQIVDIASHTRETDVLPGASAGLLYAFFFVVIIALLTVTTGPLVSSILSFIGLVALNIFGLVNIPVTIITSLIALAILLFFKPKKSFPGEQS